MNLNMYIESYLKVVFSIELHDIDKGVTVHVVYSSLSQPLLFLHSHTHGPPFFENIFILLEDTIITFCLKQLKVVTFSTW